MSSRKEEERNEKIIRGLMKLPPNRRCINCNSLGPQYVCTNFWTFVCMTCSGIHREFTHRVKSVSMAKFTSQEVEALQKGGNQRAREIYLRAWDPQRQRQPDNSNVDKVREFIKNVYVDKKYYVEKSSNRPPRDTQNPRIHEDDTRRASSYHSYSQSPPYDFQYEERRYGKHAPALSRKPGSDRGIYEGKFSSFLSPTRLSDNVYEDRFANEGSNPRVSDYSVSSGGDPFRSEVQLPNSQRDIRSPFSETSRELSSKVTEDHSSIHNIDANGHRNRTLSSGSLGSFDGNSASFKTVNFFGSLDLASEPEQSAETSHKNLSSFSSLPHSSVSGDFGGLDLFSAPFAPKNVTAADTAVSMFQKPESSVQSIDLFHESSISFAPTFSSQQSSESLPPSLDLFSEMPKQNSTSNLNGNDSDVVIQNEGWATFDMPQNKASVGSENSAPATIPSSDGNSVGKFDPFSLMHKPSSQDSHNHGPHSMIPSSWQDSLQNIETTMNSASHQSWNAFEDVTGQQPIQTTLRNSEQIAASNHLNAHQSLGFGAFEALNTDGTPRAADEREPPLSSLTSQANVMLHDFSTFSVVDGVHSQATQCQPTNPFDLPYDSDIVSSNVSEFWDMGTLQAALPNSQMPTTFEDGATEPWFTPNMVTPFVSTGSQGSLGFMGGQPPSSQITNIAAQGSVASIGGNPFA